jgi:hypothetical protein
MRLPGFTAASCLSESAHRHQQRGASGARRAALHPQASGRLGGFGGFGPTLPKCHYERRWVDCGSALPGYPVPKCLQWVYVCCWPNGACGVI